MVRLVKNYQIRSGPFANLLEWILWVNPTLTNSIPNHPDSDSSKLQVYFEYFRDADATTESISLNSKLKNLDTQIYVNSGIPENPKKH